MTVWLAVQCPDCHSTDVAKHGSSAEGKKRYSCNNSECLRRTFILDNSHPGRTRSVKHQIVEMSLNGSGVRDIARVLHVSPSTVIRELKKKKPHLQVVNQKLLETVQLEQVKVEIHKVEEEEEEGKKEPDAGIEASELDVRSGVSSSGIRKILAGSGTGLTAVRDKFWPMFLAGERMKFSSS